MHTDTRIGIRQLLAPAAAVALIAGGIIARPGDQTVDGPGFFDRAATGALASFFCPPESQNVASTEFSRVLTTAGQSAAGAEGHGLLMLTQSGQDGAYQLSIKDGQVSAKVDGKDIPEDRIKRNGDKVTILDSSGKELITFTVGSKGGTAFGVVGEPRRMFVEGSSINLPSAVALAQRTAQAASQPKVMVGITMSDAPEGVIEGIVIDRVIEGLPAKKAGIEAGDIIVHIAGVEDVSQQALRGVLSEKQPGEALTVKVLRDGALREMTIQLEAYEPSKLGMSGPTSPNAIAPAEGQNLYAWSNHPQAQTAQKAIEEALAKLGNLDHGQYTEEARKALEKAMKELESQDWAKQFEGLQFNLESVPEATWRFFSDEEGQRFTFPQGGGAWTGTNDQVQELENRLDRLEEKLDRLEKAIEKLTGDN